MNILLVDDELNIDALEQAVSDVVDSASLHSATSATEALSIAEMNVIDVVFLGIRGGRNENVSLATELAKRYPRVNIILCAPSIEYALNAWDINCSAYLLHPVTRDKVKDAMDNLRYKVAG